MSRIRIGEYRCILADPATKFNAGTKGRPQHYPRMTDDQLRRLPVGALAHPEGCWLFYWDTSPRIDITPTIAKAWGFKRSSVAWYWFKTSHFREGEPLKLPKGMGFTTRKNVEICHLFKIGAPPRLSAAIGDTMLSPRREHSRKPDEQYERIERYCAGPRIELFARKTHPGWDVWGNETRKFT